MPLLRGPDVPGFVLPRTFPGETRPTRVLGLTGPVLYHRIQNRAVRSFSSFFDGVWSSPVAGDLTDGGFAGLSVVGWFPLAGFPYSCDILRAERPVNVLYEFRDAGAKSGWLDTSNERVGEGKEDVR
ncbi:hypothetical protein DAETH_07760 [Deinococcus aetherius]|uniref:Uncharacterized protein n=1 Tax=Deinococcus aetherius TaxID=200252 RepID=A0ABM8AAM4_9DEIO|nr:hypothetical protein [Deinococcus aetherius]BDP40807.1 hypothetical protein DAETH_07760 [Deinococcus aetherius]